MNEEFSKNEIEEINKALARSEEDIKNGRVIDDEEFWERMDKIFEKYSLIQKRS